MGIKTCSWTITERSTRETRSCYCTVMRAFTQQELALAKWNHLHKRNLRNLSHEAFGKSHLNHSKEHYTTLWVTFFFFFKKQVGHFLKNGLFINILFLNIANTVGGAENQQLMPMQEHVCHPSECSSRKAESDWPLPSHWLIMLLYTQIVKAQHWPARGWADATTTFRLKYDLLTVGSAARQTKIPF